MPTTHVVSQGLAEELMEAGWPQEKSTFYRKQDSEGGEPYIVAGNSRYMASAGFVLAAPLASELLERMPPYFIRSGHLYTLIVLPKEPAGGYCARYIRNRFNTHMGGFGHAKTLPDALAKLWLHLKKEGLLK